MKKLILVVLVIVVLSIGVVTIAGAANTPTLDDGGAQAGMQSIDAGIATTAVDVSSSYSVSSMYGEHGMCDRNDSTETGAAY